MHNDIDPRFRSERALNDGSGDLYCILRDVRREAVRIAEDRLLDLDERLRAFYRLAAIDFARSAGELVRGRHVKPTFLNVVKAALLDGDRDSSLRARFGDQMVDVLLEARL